MKFLKSPSFERDVRALKTTGQLDSFAAVALKKFVPAAEAFVRDPGAGWPKGLRVKRVVNTPGVWEFTWSMNDPDGRATFEWSIVDDEPAIRWRRVGDHSIFDRP